MSSSSIVVPLRRLLAQAIEAEAEAFLATIREVRLPDGRERLVRHGHCPERLVQTGIGPVCKSAVALDADQRRNTLNIHVSFGSGICAD